MLCIEHEPHETLCTVAPLRVHFRDAVVSEEMYVGVWWKPLAEVSISMYMPVPLGMYCFFEARYNPSPCASLTQLLLLVPARPKPV
jgi:hypothetical protein